MAVEYSLNISDRIRLRKNAKLKDETDVTDYVEAVVCSLNAVEDGFSAHTDSWVSLTPANEKEGSYDVYADLTERPAWITSAAEAWASDELKANLAAQIEGKKTQPLDTTAVWVEAE